MGVNTNEDFNTPEMQEAAAAKQKEEEDLAAQVTQEQDQTDSGPLEPTS